MWIGDSGTAYHMTNNAEFVSGTRLPTPDRSRIISWRRFHEESRVFGNVDLIYYYSKTKISATLCDVGFVLGLSLFVPYSTIA